MMSRSMRDYSSDAITLMWQIGLFDLSYCRLCLSAGAVSRTLIYPFTEFSSPEASVGGRNCSDSYAMRNNLHPHYQAN